MTKKAEASRRELSRREFMGSTVVTIVAAGGLIGCSGVVPCGNFKKEKKMPVADRSSDARGDSRKILLDRFDRLKKQFERRGCSDFKWCNSVVEDTEGLLALPEDSPFHKMAAPSREKKTSIQADRLDRILWILGGKSETAGFRLRAYHIAYLMYLVDMQPAKDNFNGMGEVIEKIKANLDSPVEVVMGLDDICYCCQLLTHMECTKPVKDQIRWDGINSAIFKRLGIRDGHVMKMKAFFRLAMEKMPDGSDTCGVCNARRDKYRRGMEKWNGILADWESRKRA